MYQAVSEGQMLKKSVGASGDLSTTNFHVVRKFINSAIYVEKPISASTSSENTSITHQRYSNDDLLESFNLKTKRCTCSVDQKTCPCHKNLFVDDTNLLNSPRKELTSNTTSSKKSPLSCSAAIISKSDRVKVGLNTKFNSANTETPIKIWLNKKQEENNKNKKKNEAKDKLPKDKRDKEALLEQERQNFKLWLMNKKKTEIQARKKVEKNEKEEELKALEREKRQLQIQLNFQLWLKKKEEANLEKKIAEQMKMITELQHKEQQARENQKAFDEWLKNSKNRQKPIAPNKGIQSLCSSTSVSFMNPNPWKSQE